MKRRPDSPFKRNHLLTAVLAVGFVLITRIPGIPQYAVALAAAAVIAAVIASVFFFHR